MPSATQPAPYVPFRTFLAALEGFERGLPNQIDRSLWPSYSGAIRGQLLAAFRFLGLMDDNQSPTAALREMAAKPESRRALMRALIEKSYQPLVALDLARASPHQLEDAVRAAYGVTGATHKKAVSFFLQAVRYAGLPLSVLLKAKTRTAAFGHRRPAAGERPAKEAESAAAAVSRTVQLKSGGSLKLAASIDLFSLSAEDRAFVFGLIDRLQDYEQG
jgi:hypothetical protein